MNRAVAVIVALVVLAGSVPAAAALADTQTESDAPAPGASFAGVVGVQQAEVDNEVADRALSQQFEAADSNDSKASVVADQHQQLSERLDALEAEKERITRAYENGNMSRGEYQARLAALGAELRSLENRANRTAEAAESLPEEALRSNGANVSEVRGLAQQANRTGGGEVAEAARQIAGNGAGEGLRGPPNASERGAPDDAGPPEESEGNENGQSAGPGNGNGAGAANGQQNVTTGAPGNDTDRGNSTDRGNDTDRGNGDAPGQNDADGNETAGQQGNTSDNDARGGQGGNETGDGTAPEQPDGTGADGNSTDSSSDDGNSSDGDRQATDGTETETA